MSLNEVIKNKKPNSNIYKIFDDCIKELPKVYIENEQKKDPKYKTELCKTFSEKGKCPYGYKCRFAHGKEELNSKNLNLNYKKKKCKKFSEYGFCPYGSRCSFIHYDRKINDIILPFYFIHTFIYDIKPFNHRLNCFLNFGEEKNNEKFTNSSNVSTDFNEEENLEIESEE